VREVKVLVCGSRTWNDHLPVWLFLAGIKATNPDAVVRVCHGTAQGADTYAGEAAEQLGLEVSTFRADWTTHGRAAGPIRNKRMLDEFEPHIVVAFSEHPITKGTKHMVSIAREADIPVYVIGHAPD
jgi:F420-dependent methylenetetrahydromethanopterin dehydrogenase